MNKANTKRRRYYRVKKPTRGFLLSRYEGPPYCLTLGEIAHRLGLTPYGYDKYQRRVIRR